MRRPDLSRFYRRKLTSVIPGQFRFIVTLYRPDSPKKRQAVNLTKVAEEINWVDASAILTGTLTLRRPDLSDPRSLPFIERGHRIRLKVRWNNRTRKLWDMRVESEPAVDRDSGAVTLTLKDDLGGIRRSKREWEFKKDKQHPKGWKAHEIVRAVCRREGLRPGKIAKGTVWIKNLKKQDATGIEIIKAAYKEEADETNRKYITRMRDGRLEVIELARHRILYTVKGVESGAMLEATPKNERPITMIEGKGRVKGEKVEITVRSKAAMARFGRSSKEVDYGRCGSRAELRDKIKRDLARELKRKRTASFTIPGVPFITRGTTIRWVQKEPGWHGGSESSKNRQYAFVAEADHTVRAGEYTTRITLSQRDPYRADQMRRDRERREQKRKEKGKK